jgi:hypothetical protein
VVSPHTSRKVERNARFRREQWMTARKDQSESIILQALFFIATFRRTQLRFKKS